MKYFTFSEVENRTYVGSGYGISMQVASTIEFSHFIMHNCWDSL